MKVVCFIIIVSRSCRHNRALILLLLQRLLQGGLQCIRVFWFFFPISTLSVRIASLSEKNRSGDETSVRIAVSHYEQAWVGYKVGNTHSIAFAKMENPIQRLKFHFAGVSYNIHVHMYVHIDISKEATFFLLLLRDLSQHSIIIIVYDVEETFLRCKFRLQYRFQLVQVSDNRGHLLYLLLKPGSQYDTGAASITSVVSVTEKKSFTSQIASLTLNFSTI